MSEIFALEVKIGDNSCWLHLFWIGVCEFRSSGRSYKPLSVSTIDKTSVIMGLNASETAVVNSLISLSPQVANRCKSLTFLINNRAANLNSSRDGHCVSGQLPSERLCVVRCTVLCTSMHTLCNFTACGPYRTYGRGANCLFDHLLLVTTRQEYRNTVLEYDRWAQYQSLHSRQMHLIKVFTTSILFWSRQNTNYWTAVRSVSLAK